MSRSKETTKDTITVKFLGYKTSPELDFEMYDDILGAKEVQEITENGWVNQIHLPTIRFTNPLVKIADVRKYLNKLEKMGCNYVTIDANTDHPDYTFEGYDVHQSTQEELDEYFENERKQKEIEKTRLLQTIDKINEEIRKIDED